MIELSVWGRLGPLVEMIDASELRVAPMECPAGRARSGSDDARASATSLIVWGRLLCSEAET
jgi:hypothetical protein